MALEQSTWLLLGNPTLKVLIQSLLFVYLTWILSRKAAASLNLATAGSPGLRWHAAFGIYLLLFLSLPLSDGLYIYADSLSGIPSAEGISATPLHLTIHALIIPGDLLLLPLLLLAAVLLIRMDLRSAQSILSHRDTAQFFSGLLLMLLSVAPLAMAAGSLQIADIVADQEYIWRLLTHPLCLLLLIIGQAYLEPDARQVGTAMVVAYQLVVAMLIAELFLGGWHALPLENLSPIAESFGLLAIMMIKVGLVFAAIVKVNRLDLGVNQTGIAAIWCYWLPAALLNISFYILVATIA